MSRLLNHKIGAQISNIGDIRAFRRDGRWIPVNRILEVWKDTGTWWDGESEKTFYRVEAENGSLYEIYLDTADETWFIYRIYD